MRVNISISEGLVSLIDTYCKSRNISRSAFISLSCSDKLFSLGIDEAVSYEEPFSNKDAESST